MRAHDPIISVAELQRQRPSNDWRLIDCRFDLLHPDRGYSEWRNGHIPGAVYANLDNDLAGQVTAETGRHPLPDAQQLIRQLGTWGISNDSKVVVYDNSNGAIAARAWWLLRWLGHDSVWLLDGGYDAWLAAGGPVSASTTPPSPARFHGQPDGAMVVSTATLLEQLDGNRGVRLLDARDAARFRGEIEPIDAVAGHVPGAINRPFSDNLGTDGGWRSPEQLNSRFLDTFGSPGRADWAVMCGSGVTACHLAAAAERAGYPLPRLYVGSWSEWIRDPARPVARGA